MLIGRVLSARSFRRFTLSKIISKTWNLRNREHIERLEDNLFKFNFYTNDDKDTIFRSRPWCLNWVHMILKEWPSELSFSEIQFNTSTFIIQIHELPPMYLHEGTTRMIGNKVGYKHPNSINRRCVVARCFLRFQVDIKVKKPLPAGFSWNITTEMTFGSSLNYNVSQTSVTNVDA